MAKRRTKSAAKANSHGRLETQLPASTPAKASLNVLPVSPSNSGAAAMFSPAKSPPPAKRVSKHSTPSFKQATTSKWLSINTKPSSYSIVDAPAVVTPAGTENDFLQELVSTMSKGFTQTKNNTHPLLSFLDYHEGINSSKGWLRLKLGLPFMENGRTLQISSTVAKDLVPKMQLLLSYLGPSAAERLSHAWGISARQIRNMTNKFIAEVALLPKSDMSTCTEKLKTVVTLDATVQTSTAASIATGTQTDFEPCSIECETAAAAVQTEVAGLESDILASEFMKEAFAKSKDGLVTMRYKHGNGVREQHVLKLSVPRNTPKKRSDAFNKQFKTISAGLSKICLNHQEEIAVLQKLAKTRGLLVLRGQPEISMRDIVAIRNALGVSTGLTVRFLHALKKLAPPTVAAALPTCLKSKFAKLDKSTEVSEFGYEILPLQISLQGENKKNLKPSLFMWSKDPSSILESLVAASLIAGDKQNSTEFCSKANKVIAVFGGDKGGRNTSMILRIANRKKGNKAEFCFPVAIYRDGAESYSNLRSTFFNGDKPLKDFLQCLLDDEIYTLQLVWKTTGAATDSRCFAFRIANGPHSSTNGPAAALSIEFSHADDVLLDPTVVYPSTVIGGHRNAVASIAVQSLNESHENVLLSMALVKQNNAIIGIRICENDVLLCDFELEKAVTTTGAVEILCEQVVGFTAQDTKFATSVAGQSSCSSSCSCLVCTVLSASQFQLYPRWMKLINDTIPDAQLFDPPKREGNLCNEELYKRWVELAGRNASYLADLNSKKAVEMKRECASVVEKPLLRIHWTKNSLSSMHTFQGCGTHLHDIAREQLKAIDRHGPFHERIKTVLAEAQACVKNSAGYNAMRNKNQNLHRIGHEIESQIAALSKLPPNENRIRQIEQLRMRRASFYEERARHAAQSGFADETELRKGAGVLAKKCQDLLKSTKKSVGEAEYCFNKAIEIIAKVRFRPEHTGFELSAADGIKVLEHCESIANTVQSVYTDSPDKQQSVVEIMRKWRRLCGPLLEISKRLKSQDKPNPGQLLQLSEDICSFFHGWRSEYPERNVFLKLEHLKHYKEWADMWQMTGRVSEESFEACHPRIERLVNNLEAMATQKQVETISRQNCSHLDAAIQSSMSKVLQEGKKRGAYRNKVRVTQTNELVPVKQLTFETQEGTQHKVLPCGSGNIKDEWLEVAKYAIYNQVPAAWTAAFEKAHFGTSALVKLDYS